jgi:secreted PhoX family phosphatase
VDNSGNLVIAEPAQKRIAVAAVKTGRFYGRAMTGGDIYAVAGDGQRGVSGSGVPALQAALSHPVAVAVDSNGNVVIADSAFKGKNHGPRLQVVAVRTGTFYGRPMKAGDIYTVAGNGTHNFSGDGGPATKAGLGDRISVVRVDRAGNLVLADSSVERIRVVAVSSGTFYGRPMKAGDIYTVAGNGSRGSAGDGGPATSAELTSPQGVAADPAGNLVIADTQNCRVRVVAARTGTFYGRPMKAEDIYTVAGNGTCGFSGDGGPATSAKFGYVPAVSVDNLTGNLVIADPWNARVRVVAASTGTFYGQAMTAGDIYTMTGNGAFQSGDGGPATRAEFIPDGVAVDSAGNLMIADFSSARVRVVAASTGTSYGQAMTAGDIYTVAGNGTFGFSGDGGPATSAEVAPIGVGADGAGNLLIAGEDRVRVVAASTGNFYGQAMTGGDIYTVAGNGTSGFSGDGGPATSAALTAPQGVAVDANGNLIIADSGNYRVRVVAASTGIFYGQAMTAGDIYTMAGNGTSGFSGDGGPATSAAFRFPVDVAVDHGGNLLIADEYNERIRVVAASTGTFYGQAMTAGDIYTVAGNGTNGYSGDGIPATSAALGSPAGVAVDPAGNLVIADSDDYRVRVVAASTGTFYGQAMTAGDIYTVAGNGTPGFSGDGGPATSAELDSPLGIAVNGAGNLLIPDYSNRVRMVTG